MLRNFNILILFKFCQGFPDKISNAKHGKSRGLLFPYFHGFFAGKIIQYVRRHLLFCLALFNRAQCRFLPMLFLPLHQNREYNLDGDFCYGFSVITLIFTVICP